MRKLCRTMLWTFLAVGLSHGLKADISIDYGDGTGAAVYVSGEQVYYEPCPKGASQIRRGCAGERSGDRLFSIHRDVFARGVQSFFSLIDRDFGGVYGAATLDKRIDKLKEHLATSELAVNELKEAGDLLRSLVTAREKWDQADREILSYLVAGKDIKFSAPYQRSRVIVVEQAFGGVAYLPDQKRLFRISPHSVSWFAQHKACGELGKAWAPVTDPEHFKRGFRDLLFQSAVVNPSSPPTVWTAASTEPQYRVTCGFSCGPSHSDTQVTFYSVEEFHSKERLAARYGGICHYTNGCNITQQSYDYFPRTAVSADLTPYDHAMKRQAVEASEGTDSGVKHPVLCEREIVLEGGFGSLGNTYLVSFSLYDLDRSFDKLARLLYANRAAFFRRVAKAVATTAPLSETESLVLAYRSALTRLFVLNAIDPLLRDIQTNRLERYILPDYERAKEEWNKKLKVTRLSDIDLFGEVYRLALELLRGGLEASEPYLVPDDRTAVREILTVVGRALAGGPRSVTELTGELGKRKPLIDRIIAGPRTHGFGVMIASIGEYLEAKR